MDKENKVSNIDILNKIRQGDTLTLKSLYENYFSSIRKYILENNGTMADAKDIFQEAIIVLFQKSKDSDFALKASIHTYLFSISKNLWLKKLRNKFKNTGDLHDNMELIDNDSFEGEIKWREKQILYKEKFSLLGDVCKKLISLFLGGKSMEEICTVLNLSSPAYAKKKKYKCKLKLMKLIKEDPKYVGLVE